jgi:hypothetical protein
MLKLARRVAARYMQASFLRGDARTKMVELQKHCDKLSQKIRHHRKEYEMYLYQALGRKVDFEEIHIEQGDGLQCNVIAKYIVQRDTTEPLASRFFLDLRVAPKEQADGVQELDLSINAGFINSIGMKHAKFTQENFRMENLESPTAIFGWVEYLEGDFLKARRLVRPFGKGDMDMGITDQ